MALRQTKALQAGSWVEVEHSEIPLYVPEIRFNLSVRGQSAEELPEHTEHHNLLARLQWEECTDCIESNRKVLPYKLQLRSDVGILSPRDLLIADHALNEALYLHPSRYERKEVEGGVDLEFENPRTVGEILAVLRRKRVGEERKSSEGVVRLSSGSEVVKWTYVFRFLSLEPGEIIHLEEGDVRVERLTKGEAFVFDLKTHKRSALPIERLFDAKSAANRG